MNYASYAIDASEIQVMQAMRSEIQVMQVSPVGN